MHLYKKITRVVKILYLISKVSPYQRIIQGAPSIFVFGDSTGYGTGASRKNDSIAGLVGRDFPQYTIRNNSKNGRTIGELVNVIKKLEFKQKLILLQIGGNDILQKRNIALVEKELREIIEILSPHTDHLIMMSTGNVGAAAAFAGDEAMNYEMLTRAFRKMFIKVSSETAMTYVDLFKEREQDPFLREPKKYLAWDKLHPSSVGYAFWYQSLKPVLEKIL